MAKEMMIVFVYDIEASEREETELDDVLLYFHPSWVADSQKFALAGQVVGTAQCVKHLFDETVSISLMCGKFVVINYGRFVLGIGSDRNIPDWVLNNRVKLLTSIIKTYHGDLNNIVKLACSQNLSTILYLIFETYLPILQYGCHIFQRVPLLTLPKSATSVFLESMQILDQCRFHGSLGGVMLYNNKIIASQLPADLTSYLVVVDPFRIKSPAENLHKYVVPPVQTQVIVIYVPRKDYVQLKQEAGALIEFKQSENTIMDYKMKLNAENNLPTMQRDQSLLFTAVPEEIQVNSIQESTERQHKDIVPFANRPKQRPNNLSLFKKDDSKENTNPPYDKPISVSTTPMVEIKKLHCDVFSLCQNTEPIHKKEVTKVKKQVRIAKDKPFTECKILTEINNIGDHYINNENKIKKQSSFSDIRSAIRRMKSKFKSKYLKGDEEDFSDTEDETRLNTINDPWYPIFKDDGTPISSSLYKEYVNNRKNDSPLNHSDNEAEEDDNDPNFEKFSSDWKNSPKKVPSVQVTSKCDRKKLSLPLKSLAESGSDDDQTMKGRTNGVQLTPLMEKLSQIAIERSGFNDNIKTPRELRDYITTFEKSMPEAIEEESPLQEEQDADMSTDEELSEFSKHSVRCALFVLGLQNMSTLLVLDTASLSVEMLNTLWEMIVEKLGDIEQKCMEPAQLNNEPTNYSYLTLDNDWGTIKKGGPWNSSDIALMGFIHSEFEENEELSEFIIRTEESVVLGSTCGGAEVFYQENSTKQAGLPMPSDAMSTVQMTAKKRLLRDHSIVIL